MYPIFLYCIPLVLLMNRIDASTKVVLTESLFGVVLKFYKLRNEWLDIHESIVSPSMLTFLLVTYVDCSRIGDRLFCFLSAPGIDNGSFPKSRFHEVLTLPVPSFWPPSSARVISAYTGRSAGRLWQCLPSSRLMFSTFPIRTR